MKQQKALLVAAVVTVAALFTSANGAQAAPRTEGPVLASYNGRTLDLSKSWEDARACNVTASGSTCYSTEAAMDAAIASAPTARLAAGTCSTALRLYDGTSYTGQALNIYTTQALPVLALQAEPRPIASAAARRHSRLAAPSTPAIQLRT